MCVVGERLAALPSQNTQNQEGLGQEEGKQRGREKVKSGA